MIKRQTRTILLIIILVVAASLRFFGLSRGDTINDEVLYGFRAIGPMDFDEAAEQTTPFEWFDGHIPWWAYISFHDHPPLVFWIQHFSLKAFGENNFGLRFPSALLGVASVWFLFQIGSMLYSEKVGLLGAGLLAISINNVYVSRLGLQEPFVIFFMLIAIYFFLKSLKKDSYLILTGVMIGLGMLAKYTAFILVPIFLTYLLLFRKDYFKNKKFWLGALVALIIASPIIIYNIELYRAVGHFDFQLAFIFHQNHPVWQVSPGKEIGSLGNRVKNFPITIMETNSWALLSVFAFALGAFFASLYKNYRATLKLHSLAIISFAYLSGLIIFFIGDSYRFLTLLGPFILLACGVFLAWLLRYSPNFMYGAAALFVLFEIFYTVNSVIAYYPAGSTPWAHSKVRLENFNWGFNNLQPYLDRELGGKMPAVAFEQKYKFVAAVQEQALDADIAQKLPRYSAVIIYDGNINSFAQLWNLDRLQIYHAWPVLKTETYIGYLSENRLTDIQKDGFEKHYFIALGSTLPVKSADKLTQTGAAFEKELLRRGIGHEKIYNRRGEEAFRVYKY